MSKSKKHLKRTPQQRASEFNPVFPGMKISGDLAFLTSKDIEDALPSDTISLTEEIVNFTHEYYDTYEYPGYDEIPGRENYPKRDIGVVRRGVDGKPVNEIQELVECVVNDGKVSEDNQIVKQYGSFSSLNDISDFHDRVNRMMDYKEALVCYARNIKEGILNLPSEARRQQLLVGFSFQDLLDTIVNYSGAQATVYEILAQSCLDVLHGLANEQISKAEALAVSKDIETKIAGLGYIDELEMLHGTYEISEELNREGILTRDDRWRAYDDEEGE